MAWRFATRRASRPDSILLFRFIGKGLSPGNLARASLPGWGRNGSGVGGSEGNGNSMRPSSSSCAGATDPSGARRLPTLDPGTSCGPGRWLRRPRGRSPHGGASRGAQNSTRNCARTATGQESARVTDPSRLAVRMGQWVRAESIRSRIEGDKRIGEHRAAKVLLGCFGRSHRSAQVTVTCPPRPGPVAVLEYHGRRRLTAWTWGIS
jgi:hypothetical protein